MPVNLTTAQAGERYEARDKGVWTYVGSSNKVGFSHLLGRGNGEIHAFTEEGDYLFVAEHDWDLIRALDSPAPAPAEPMGDAVLVERLRAHRDVLLARGDHVSSMHIDEAAIRIEALSTENAKHVAAANEAQAEIDQLHADAEEMTAALDEARKVIAPFATAVVRTAHLRAARDWHSKHGGA